MNKKKTKQKAKAASQETGYDTIACICCPLPASSPTNKRNPAPKTFLKGETDYIVTNSVGFIFN